MPIFICRFRQWCWIQSGTYYQLAKLRFMSTTNQNYGQHLFFLYRWIIKINKQCSILPPKYGYLIMMDKYLTFTNKRQRIPKRLITNGQSRETGNIGYRRLHMFSKCKVSFYYTEYRCIYVPQRLIMSMPVQSVHLSSRSSYCVQISIN